MCHRLRGWYVAIAEALGAPLATLDHRLARASTVRCRFITPGAPIRPSASPRDEHDAVGIWRYHPR